MSDINAIRAKAAELKAHHAEFNRKLRAWDDLMDQQTGSHPKEPTMASRIAEYLNALPPVTAQPFILRRHRDVTGVSGTGIVADGVLFPAAGKSRAVVRWRGERGSTVVWDHLGHVQEIHGHDGATVIELVPVGELIAALKAVAALQDADRVPGVPGHAAEVKAYNTALADVRLAITDAIEALHGHGEES